MVREPAGRSLRGDPTHPARPAPDRIGAGLVAGAALAVSLSGLGNRLVQDDISLLVESDRLHGLSQWREILGSPYWPPPHSPDLWRPVTSLLLALEHGAGGGSPLAFRIASYLLYAAVAVVVYRLAGRVVPARLALFLGLLFAVHPVHVEAVALAVGQGELLVALLGGLMVIRYLDRRAQPDGLRGRDWVALGLLYLGASLAKEHGLILPGLLLTVELTLGRGARGAWQRLLPGYAGLGAVGVLVLLVRRLVLGGALAGTFAAAPLDTLDLGGRFRLMLQVVPHWGRLLAWPFHLQADYSPREIAMVPGLGGTQLLGAGLLAAALGLAAAARRRAPVVTLGLLWIGLTLVPVSNVLIPSGVLLAERTLFLPSVGFGLLVGGLLLWLGEAAAGRVPRVRAPAVALGAIALLAFAARSADRHRVWRDDRSFRVALVRDAPRSWRAQLAYASLLFESGQRDSALARYGRAAEYAPERERWKVRNDLALEFLASGAGAEAVEQLRRSLAEAPEQESTRHYLVLGLLSLGSYVEAGAQADTAMARGGSREVFGELRQWADSAGKLGLPPGAIRIRVRPPGP